MKTITTIGDLSEIYKTDATSFSKAKISADCLDEDELKKLVIQILLEDPDSEVKNIAENYLIQCLYKATEDPENNPILKKFFGEDQKEEIARLSKDVKEIWNEVIMIKSELQDLKYKLDINPYHCPEGGVAWRNDVQAQFNWFENKILKLIETLGKAGIDISHWED